MNLKNFQELCQRHLDDLEDIIKDNMKENGLTQEDCQRLCILQAVKEVGMVLDGVVDDDLV